MNHIPLPNGAFVPPGLGTPGTPEASNQHDYLQVHPFQHSSSFLNQHNDLRLSTNLGHCITGPNSAIRSALELPSGPISAQDILRLINLDASRRNIRSTVGLEAARNLVSLNLEINGLTNFSVPSTLTNLSVLTLSGNPLSSFSVPSGLTNLTSLTVEGCNLTNLTIPATLTALTNLDAEGNNLANIILPETLTGLVELDLGFNQFTNFTLPSLSNLSSFYFAGNPLSNVTFPLSELHLHENLLTSFTLPTGMTNLEELELAENQFRRMSFCPTI